MCFGEYPNQLIQGQSHPFLVPVENNPRCYYIGDYEGLKEGLGKGAGRHKFGTSKWAPGPGPTTAKMVQGQALVWVSGLLCLDCIAKQLCFAITKFATWLWALEAESTLDTPINCLNPHKRRTGQNMPNNQL